MLFQNSLLPQNLSNVSSSNLVFKRYGMYWFLMSLTTTVVGTVSTVLLVLGTIQYDTVRVHSSYNRYGTGTSYHLQYSVSTSS